jgi:hypothetical protein
VGVAQRWFGTGEPCAHARCRGFGFAGALLFAVAAFAAASPARADLDVESLGVPIRTSGADSSRTLVRGTNGEWSFIGQYRAGSPLPTEMVIKNLTTGVQKTVERPAGSYSDGCRSDRAANQRVFYTEFGRNGVMYYEPSTQTFEQLGPVPFTTTGDQGVYRWIFGSNGLLYAGTTTTKAPYQPAIIEINPSTLAYRNLGQVGSPRSIYSYAYYLAPDPPWVYVAVGQQPWELFAINLVTGEKRHIALPVTPSFLQFSRRNEGWTVSVVQTGAPTTLYWVADGALHTFVSGYQPTDLPFAPRSVAAAGTDATGDQPQLDFAELAPDTAGISRLKFLPAGATQWSTATMQVNHIKPYNIESLLALPDGSLLGNASQYTGFFTHSGTTGPITKRLLVPSVSGGKRIVVGDLVYMSGYPNGVLLSYDPAKPWVSTTPTEATDNPVVLGTFYPTTDSKYAGSLVSADNGRLYFSGRRERSGVGGGVGYYDLGAKQFTGHYRAPLNFLVPRGLARVSTDAGMRVVYSGELRDDPLMPTGKPAQSELQVYDDELNEVESLVVKPGLTNLGHLFAGAPGQVIGVLTEPTAAVYRYDLNTKSLLDWLSVPKLTNLWQTEGDPAVFLLVDGVVSKLDPTTLAITPLAALATPADSDPAYFDAANDSLYYAIGPELFRARWNPIAAAQEVSTRLNRAVAFQLTGKETTNQALSFTVLTQPSHGALSGTAPNLTYTPEVGYVGADAFTFRVTAGSKTSLPETVSIEVLEAAASGDGGPDSDDDPDLPPVTGHCSVSAPGVAGSRAGTLWAVMVLSFFAGIRRRRSRARVAALWCGALLLACGGSGAGRRDGAVDGPGDAPDDAVSEWDGGAPPDASVFPPDGGLVEGGHPRLWLDATGWANLATSVAAHAPLATLEAQLRAEADAFLTESPPLFNCTIPSGNIGRVVLDRVYLFAYLARRLPMGEREPYVARAKAELLTAVAAVEGTNACFAFADARDLVKAEYAHAVAIGYDWLYEDLSEPERADVVELLVRFINHARERFGATGVSPYWWTTTNSNWNLVCNGGFALAALAVLDDAGPAPWLQSLDALNRIFVSFDAGGGSIRYGLAGYAPTGDWFEGPGYWHYATRYAVPAIASVRTALGNDALHDELMRSPGFAASYAYRLHVRGPMGLAFNTSDAPADFGFTQDGDSFVGYLSKGLTGDDAARAQQIAWNDIVDETATPDALRVRYVAAVSSLVAFSGTGGSPPTLPTVKQFGDTAFQRSGWDTEASWAALLAGSNLPQTHEHLDMGSFAFQADGVSWIEELGSDNYALKNYFSNTLWDGYYRRETKGHNTLRFGVQNQVIGAAADATFVGGAKSGSGVSFARVQMKSAYSNAGVTSALRGAALVGQPRKMLLLADDVQRSAGSASVAMEWQAHTRATTRTVLEGGRVLELGANGKRARLYLLEPSSGTFVVATTGSVKIDANGQKESTREAWRRITVTQNVTTAGKVRVLFVPESAAAFSKTIAEMTACIAEAPNCLNANAESVLTDPVASWQ